ncbi:MAG TPA: glycosyltransferase family 39 protein [Pyrinomonadaceae bacterium]|jgi:4-amino-4-deoxy-L-arabinose transferase-like glycosyltransferase|nr:glycosyltransferase family 39 protein [Pyrinomonadaceae bacterium]
MKPLESTTGEKPDRSAGSERTTHRLHASRRQLFLVVLILLTALGVRLLNWQNHHDQALAVQTSVALNYKHQARLLRANGVASLYNSVSPTNDPDLMGHPPGYPILLSVIYRVAGESDKVTQLLQMVLDSLSVVIIVLIAFEFFPAAVGLIAGLIAAFAPQFSWNSLTLLPDSLAALPILLAVLVIARCRTVGQAFPPVGLGTVRFKQDRPECLSYANDRSRLLPLLAAGALIGVSCWLRANALLLAPFLACLFLFTCKRGARLRAVLIFMSGTLLVISLLTIRNAIVFGKFIPVSLGSGQTLIEGIADYNTDGSLGLPQTDMELIRGEAETLHRAEYANSLFTPDGIERDRARMTRGFTVVRTHPVWFAGVMLRRGASMLRLERTPLRLANNSEDPIHWTLRVAQKLFITALFLPLAIIGAGILFYRKNFQALAILFAVPGYYFCVQSALHTEYRYVLVIHYFLFVLSAVALYTIGCKLTAAWKTAR